MIRLEETTPELQSGQKVNIMTAAENLIPILSKTELIQQTELLVRNEGMGYSEAIVSICNSRGIEPEDIAKMVSGTPLKDKLRAEAQRNNLLPKPNSLFD